MCWGFLGGLIRNWCIKMNSDDSNGIRPVYLYSHLSIVDTLGGTTYIGMHNGRHETGKVTLVAASEIETDALEGLKRITIQQLSQGGGFSEEDLMGFLKEPDILRAILEEQYCSKRGFRGFRNHGCVDIDPSEIRRIDELPGLFKFYYSHSSIQTVLDRLIALPIIYREGGDVIQ